MDLTYLDADVCIVNTLAQCQEYGWGWDFCKKEIQAIYDKLADKCNAQKVQDELTDITKNGPAEDTKLASIYFHVRKILSKMKCSTADNREDIANELKNINAKYQKIVFDGDFLENLTFESANKFGFKQFNDNVHNGKTLALIPIWASFVFPQDMEVISIFGDKSTLGKCDKDTRMGCLTFGIMLSVEEKATVAKLIEKLKKLPQDAKVNEVSISLINDKEVEIK